MSTEHDYDLKKKIHIKFKGMDYVVMPRYREHYLSHEYERFSLQILKNNLSAESLFVDVGAHYGAYSLYAAHESKSSVYALEPVDENFTLLNENIELNKLKKLVKTFQYAASNKNGEAVFNIPWASDSAGFYTHPNAETIRQQKVITKKVDDVVGKKRVDIIKIDTEGHEIGVLNGLQETLKNNPDLKLIIEINPPLLKNAGSSAEALLEMVRDFGKEIYMIDEDGFVMHRITDRLETWPKYINEGNYANLYCVPAKSHQYALFVSHTASTGGAELAMVEQIVQLRIRNVISHVILPSTGPLETMLVARGIGYTIVPEYSFWTTEEALINKPDLLQKRCFNNIQAALAITAVAKEINPTVIINNSMVNPWGVIAAQACGLPLIWMVHEFGDLDHEIAFAHNISDTRKFIINSSDLVLCCSEAVRNHFLQGGRSDKVRTLYNFLDLASIIDKADFPPERSLSKDKSLKLCCVGTLSEGKGQTVLIDAFALLRKSGVPAQLWLVGAAQPGYESRLKAQAKKLGVADSVMFTGYTPNPYPYIRAADALVVAARNEAFGRVTAEAMTLGTPVIAARSGGSLELIVEDETGLMYNPLDVEDLTQTIHKFTKMNKNDVRNMTIAAKHKIADLINTSKNADELAQLINTIAATRRLHTTALLTSEWISAFNAANDEFDRLHIEISNAMNQVKGQEQINFDLAKRLNEITNSKGYRVARKLSKIKHKLKHGR